MKTIVGVRFRHTGKSYYFDPGELELNIGTPVIVKTSDGLEYGRVSIPPLEREEDKMPAIIKQIVRIATEEDTKTMEENQRLEEEAYRICKIKIKELELPMKLIHAEYTFEKNKLLFYFSAEGRVDFRELVRLLAAEFRTRIELRQIGVRDETKMLGGIGICGRELCCNTYLSGFTPVSIKMAKEQNLSLNPTKISGVCGRLMCCLAHEEEVYEYLNRTMPKSGDFATNVEGQTGVIRSVNILKQSVLVIFEDGDTREMKEYPVSEVGLSQRREGMPSPEKVANIQKQLQEVLEKKLEEELSLVKERNAKEYWDESEGEKTTDNTRNKANNDKDNGRKRRKNSEKRQSETSEVHAEGKAKDKKSKNKEGRNRFKDQNDRDKAQGRQNDQSQLSDKNKDKNQSKGQNRSTDKDRQNGRNRSGERGKGQGRNSEKRNNREKERGKKHSPEHGNAHTKGGFQKGFGKKKKKDSSDFKQSSSKGQKKQNDSKPNKDSGKNNDGGNAQGHRNGGYSRGY